MSVIYTVAMVNRPPDVWGLYPEKFIPNELEELLGILKADIADNENKHYRAIAGGIWKIALDLRLHSREQTVTIAVMEFRKRFKEDLEGR